MSSPRTGRRAATGWSVVLALLVTAPLLPARGYTLVGDMVFVPSQPWKDAWLAADGSVPRAVPSDAIVSLLTQVLPGDLLQKLVLLGLLVGAGTGVAHLLREYGTVARVVAVSAFVWNPYVYERLAIGHWALLCGYAALPWVMSGAVKVRDREPGAVAALGLPVLVAAWTSPTGGVLAALVATAVVLGRPSWRSLGVTLSLVTALNLPWIVPGIAASAPTAPDEAGVAGFAAVADTPLGVLGSVATLGGIWKTSVAAPGRESWVIAVFAVLLVVLALIGLVRRGAVERSPDRPARLSLTAVAVVCVLLAWLPAVDTVRPAFEWLGTNLPGAGLLRDSQKWVAPIAVLWAVGLARFVDLAGRRLVRHGPVAPLWLLSLALLPLLCLPSLAWGLFGRLEPVAYPDEWQRVADLLEDTGSSSDRLVVLPFEIYQRFDWNEDRALLDPAPRFLPVDVVTNDVLRLRRGVDVAGEDPVAARISSGIEQGRLEEVLDEERVRWVLVHRGVPGSEGVVVPAGAVAHEGATLALVDRGQDVRAPQRPTSLVVWAVNIGVASLGAALLVLGVRGRLRRYSASQTRKREGLC